MRKVLKSQWRAEYSKEQQRTVENNIEKQLAAFHACDEVYISLIKTEYEFFWVDEAMSFVYS